MLVLCYDFQKQRIGLSKYPGGVPSSQVNSGQQWDLPNSWAPHVHFFVEALDKTGNGEAQQMALTIAQKWLANVYISWKKTSHMIEKVEFSFI